MLKIFSFFSLCLLGVYGQTPVVTITDPVDKTAEAVVNKPAFITCRVVDRKEKSVEWYLELKNGEGKHLSNNEQVFTPQYHMIDHPAHSPESWRLTIKNVRKSDEGTYKCRVWTSQTSFISDTVIVSVVEPPTIAFGKSSQSVVVAENEPHQLRCVAYGVPEVTTFWSRLGGEVLPVGGITYNSPVMDIKSVKPNYRGNYTCTARNKVGMATLNITLGVQFKPVVSFEREVYKQKTGYDKELSCYVEANPMVKEKALSWSYGGSVISTGDSSKYVTTFLRGANFKVTYRLYIRDVSDSDFGSYMCSARTLDSSEGARSASTRLEYSEDVTEVLGVVDGASTCRLGLMAAAAALLAAALLY